MRAVVLAGVALAALSGAPVRAQFIVSDPGHTLQTALGWAQQAKDAIAQLQQLQRNYQMITSTYNALAGARNVGDIAGALGSVTHTYAPEYSSTVSAIGQGARLLNGRAGSFMSADQLYLPQAAQGARAMEGWLTEMQRRSLSTASAKALASDGLQDMEGRIATLGAAEARLSTSRDVNDVTAVNGLIAASSQNLAAHQAIIASATMMLHAEDRSERQRAEQRQMQNADELAAATSWAVEGGFNE